jgi:DNA-binding response OmpR family regulator
MLTDKAVLIVEDNVYLSVDLSAAVEEVNGRVIGPVCSVADALLILDTEHVSAAILDCELPDSQVTPVARRLVEKGVPYVIHTGTMVPYELTLLSPEAPILMKPIKPMDVVAVLADHAAQSKKNEEA